MIWAIIIGVALVTFLLRLSFLASDRAHAMPESVQAVLRYVAPAVLAAIVVPPIVLRDDALQIDPGNPRLLAALAAFLIAALTKSVAGTIAGGMAVLWLAEWLVG